MGSGDPNSGLGGSFHSTLTPRQSPKPHGLHKISSKRVPAFAAAASVLCPAGPEYQMKKKQKIKGLVRKFVFAYAPVNYISGPGTWAYDNREQRKKTG